MHRSFEFCDVDGSQYIDRDELDLLLSNIGSPPRTATGFEKLI